MFHIEERDEAWDDHGLPYLLFTPTASRSDPSPLILFLHGSGERGDSLSDVMVHSLPCLARSARLPRKVGGEPFPFVLACPQIRSGRWRTESARLLALVEALAANDGIDSDRVYVTGVSMGAIGAWKLAASAPSSISAIAPVSWNMPRDAMAVDVPAWVFVGARDERVDPEQVAARLFARRARDEHTKLTVCPDGGHSGEFWNAVYSRMDIYEWLLRHRTPSTRDRREAEMG